jgi:hypothetical protein
MLSTQASSVLIVAALALALYVLMRRFPASGGARRDTESALRRSRPIPRLVGDCSNEKPRAQPSPEWLRWQVEMEESARELKVEIDGKLSALQALVPIVQQEAQRLEAMIARAEALTGVVPQDSLATLEELADRAALDNPDALGQVAAQLSPLPSEFDSDLFATDQKTLQIARLWDQGQSAADIAHRLQLPLGEVELMLSLRSA